jgi:hypothetical protein
MYTIASSQTSGRGTKVLQSITAALRGVLLCAGSVWFVYTKLIAIVFESTYIMFSITGKEKMNEMLDKLNVPFTSGVALALAVLIGIVTTMALYGAMIAWGFEL